MILGGESLTGSPGPAYDSPCKADRPGAVNTRPTLTNNGSEPRCRLSRILPQPTFHQPNPYERITRFGGSVWLRASCWRARESSKGSAPVLRLAEGRGFMDSRKLSQALGALASAAQIYEIAASRTRTGDVQRAAHLTAAANRLCDAGLRQLTAALDEARSAAQRGEAAPLPPITRGDREGWPLAGHKAFACPGVRP